MGLFNALVSGSFLPWRWRAKQETDYETILSGLAKDITEVQTRLTQIRTRERRASVTLTLQAFLVWALYTIVCWFLGLLSFGQESYEDGEEGSGSGLLLVWAPVVLSPILIIFTRKIVRFWYRRVGAAEEKHLVELRRQQRDKIDEIKRATKYDHLRMLLEKYDETQPRAAKPPVQQQRPAPPGATPSSKQQQQLSPQQAQQQQPQQPRGPLTPEQAHRQAQQMAAMRQQGNHGTAAALGVPRPLPPQQPLPKTWMDKVADAVLGADPSSAGPEQKYALICTRCYMHNGLALKEEFDEIQYVCPHCGQFNSRRPSSAPHSSPFTSRIVQRPGLQSVVPSPAPHQRHPLAQSSSLIFGEGDVTPDKAKSPAASGGRPHGDGADGDDDDDDDTPPPANPLDGNAESDEDSDGAPVTNIDTPSKSKGVSHTLRSRTRRESTKGDGMEVDDE
ncbi:hypothetical protein ACQY0O_006168 [Thecaphora frezii]